ncbi:Casein kinase I isoform gamma-1 [Hypsibius exemplaris]|uniref:non-specific serine/threonine protein kinase n=1 Tax=Hypsibius exemplaris TaxID=2072580 RepID=A0A1W0WD71_HYPEX|nr:Casein kinase I isoform gamma-1 [Hypsibius exemplaris]
MINSLPQIFTPLAETHPDTAELRPAISVGSSKITDIAGHHSAASQQLSVTLVDAPSPLNDHISGHSHHAKEPQGQFLAPPKNRWHLLGETKSDQGSDLSKLANGGSNEEHKTVHADWDANNNKPIAVVSALLHPSPINTEKTSTESQNLSLLSPSVEVPSTTAAGTLPKADRPDKPQRVSRVTAATKPQHETRSGVREREDAELLIGSIVGKQWFIDRKIASGSFGTLFMGRNINTKEPVAVKAERRDSTFPQLHREKKFYQMLVDVDEGVPHMLFYGECSTGNRYHILVMDLLGPNVEDLLQACGGTFSLKTTCMLACQLLSRMEYLHSKGILYRDIKSENFLIGRRKTKQEDVLHVVDFGLSKEFINPVSKQHIPFNVKKGSVGTPRYMSINALQHHEQGRRDDLEALSYLFLYLYFGQLPWQGLPGSTFAEKCKRILEKKLKLSVDEVCRDAPAEFARFMKYARNLDYEAQPDYKFCRQLFLDMLKHEHLAYDNVYDWSGDHIPDFWKEKNKLVDTLPPLPDDLSARIRAAEKKDIPYSLRLKKKDKRSKSGADFSRNSRADRNLSEQPELARKKSGTGCCPCFSGATRSNSRTTID